MTIINKNYSDLESSSKLRGLCRFETFDINSFICDKHLVIEKVEVDEHINFEVRIYSDETVYNDDKDYGANKDKIITLQVDSSMSNDVNIVNIIGHTIVLKDLHNSDAVIYGNNALKVNIKRFAISPDKLSEYIPTNNLTVADYKLSKLNQYKAFDSEKFLSEHQMKILTIYAQSPTTARIIAIITDDGIEDETETNVGKTFSIRIEMNKVRDIPLELLIGNKSFHKENLKGNINGIIVKKNQVLLDADAFKIVENEKEYTIGNKDTLNNTNSYINNNMNKDMNKDVSSITNSSTNTNVNKHLNNQVSDSTNNYANNNFNSKKGKHNKKFKR